MIMKNFLSQNWYRLTLSISALVFSLGFLIRSVNPVYGESINNSQENISYDEQIYWVESDGVAYQIGMNGAKNGYKVYRELKLK